MRRYILALVVFAFAFTIVGASATLASFNDTVKSANNPFGSATVAAPTGLTACLASAGAANCGLATTTDGSTVRIFWTAAAGATGYKVYRSPDGATFTPVGTIGSGATVSYTDSNPRDAATASCTACTYRVTAVYTSNGANWESQSSNPTAGPVKPLDHFLVTVPGSNQTSGTAFTTSLTAQAADNSTIANYNGTATLSVSNPLPAGSTATLTAPAAAVSLASGVNGSVSTNITTNGTSVTLVASGGSPARTGSATVTFAPVVTNITWYATNSACTLYPCDLSLTNPGGSATKDIGEGVSGTWSDDNGPSAEVGDGKINTGSYSVTIKRAQNSSDNSTASVTVSLGYLDFFGTFQPLGSATLTFPSASSAAQTQTGTIAIATAYTLVSTDHLAIRVSNATLPSGGHNLRMTLDGTSFISGPFSN